VAAPLAKGRIETHSQPAMTDKLPRGTRSPDASVRQAGDHALQAERASCEENGLSSFITFEGPEGSGKTTQMQQLAEYLEQQGCDVLCTREPGGSRIGDRVREILLNPDHTEMARITEFLLFSAARAQHVEQVIRPHLERGGVVVCDRYADSSLAYQGYGNQLDLDTLRLITRFATGHLSPDLTLYLDIDVVEGLRRKVGGDGDAWNRIEEKGIAYHQRVRDGYLAMIAQEPKRWVRLNAARDVHQIQASIRQEVQARGILAGARRIGGKP
jgi:dTMP kinase